MKNANSGIALLIDGDMALYQACSNAEQEINWGVHWTLHSDPEEAYAIFKNAIEKLCLEVNSRLKLEETPRVYLAFTDSVNWRKDVLETYKSNRKEKRKPLCYYIVRDRVFAEWECLMVPTLEGDDVLGIWATSPHIKGRKIIVSGDKDFKTIPGEFWDYGRKKFYDISEEEANYWHLYQALMGDITDGYQGCPGMGAGTAEEFLKEPFMWFQEEKILKSGPRKGEAVLQWKKRELSEGETLWDAVVSCFIKAGKTAEDALVQAQVARICRSSEWDFKTRKVIPWVPS